MLKTSKLNNRITKNKILHKISRKKQTNKQTKTKQNKNIIKANESTKNNPKSFNKNV